jgi:hypothetical protein
MDPTPTRLRSRTLLFAAVAVAAVGLAETGYYFRVYRPRRQHGAQEQARLAGEARARGGLVVTSVPPGAEVEVGGQPSGRSPLTLPDLRVGSCPVVLRLEGYEEQRLEAEVKEGAVAEIGVALVRSTGGARIESDPPGLAFELEGGGATRRGTTPATLEGLPTGGYALTAHREGWPDQGQAVAVARNQISSARVAFAGGALDITSAPAGAEVWEGGRKLGSTPLRIDGLAPGARDLELRLPGFSALRQRADVRPGAAVRVAATLLPLPGPQPGAPWENSLGMKFVPVPGTAVLFSVWDTRVKDFEAFVRATGRDATADMYTLRPNGWKPRGDTWRNPGFAQGPTHPVCGVSWDDAKAFCAWLTAKERAEARLGPAQEYRLPTDAEWSVAVGLDEGPGGTPREKSGRVADVYPWGAQWPPPKGAGNYAGSEARDANWPESAGVIEGYDDGYARTSPVGSFAANRFGLYDMGGNVWQWCEDWFDTDRSFRVLRGASFSDQGSGDLLSSTRFNFGPGVRYDVVGFRCVVTVAAARAP